MKELDTASAVTRSMLGWGVLAGPLYLTFGLALGLTRDGFDLSRHALSLLMLGDGGWMQRANLAISGLLCLVAAIAVHRATASTGARTRAGRLVGVFAIGLLGSATFAPDPMGGFPAGAPEGFTVSGALHMVFGLVQFVSLAIAALSLSRWAAARHDVAWALGFRAAAVVILVGFVGGAVLGQTRVGVALLWIAVVTGYGWLAAACRYLWPIVPHPVIARRGIRTHSKEHLNA